MAIKLNLSKVITAVVKEATKRTGTPSKADDDKKSSASTSDALVAPQPVPAKPTVPKATTPTTNKPSTPSVTMNGTLGPGLNGGPVVQGRKLNYAYDAFSREDAIRSAAYDTAVAKAAEAARGLNESPILRNDVKDTYNVDDGGNILDDNGNVVDGVNLKTQFNVETITVDKYTDELYEKLKNGEMEVWVIDSGNGLRQQKTYNYDIMDDEDTHVVFHGTSSATCIGRDRLAGISPDDACVFYDPETKKLYRYANDPTKADVFRTAYAYIDEASQVMLERDTDPELLELQGKVNDLYDQLLKKYPAITQGIYPSAWGAADKVIVQEILDAQDRITEINAGYEARKTELMQKFSDTSAPIARELELSNRVAELYELREKKAHYEINKNRIGTAVGRDMDNSAYIWSDEDEQRLQELEKELSAADTDLFVSPDLLEEYTRYSNEIRNGIGSYEREAANYTNMASDTQINSLNDVLRREVGREAYGSFSDSSFSTDLNSWWKLKYGSTSPFRSALDEEGTIKDAAQFDNALIATTKGIFTSFITELAEDLDWTNVLKPSLVASDMYINGNYDNPEVAAFVRSTTDAEWAQLSTEERSKYNNDPSEYATNVGWKMYWGAYGTTYNFDYLSSTKDKKLADYASMMLLEIVLDPANIVGWVGKAVKATTAAATVADIAADSGASMLDDLVENVYEGLERSGAKVIKPIDGVDYAKFAEDGVQVMFRTADTDAAIRSHLLDAVENSIKNSDDSLFSPIRAFFTSSTTDTVKLSDAFTDATAKLSDDLFGDVTRVYALNNVNMANPAVVNGIARSEPARQYLNAVAALEENKRLKFFNAFDDMYVKAAENMRATVINAEQTLTGRLSKAGSIAIRTFNTIDDLLSATSKFTWFAAAPEFYIPYKIVHAIKNNMLGDISEATTKELLSSVTRMSEAVKGAMDMPSIATHEFFSELEDLTKDVKSLVTLSDVGAARAWDISDNTIRHGVFEYMFEQEVLPINKLLNNITNDPIDTIDELNKFATTKLKADGTAFADIMEYMDHLKSVLPQIAVLSKPHADYLESMFRAYDGVLFKCCAYSSDELTKATTNLTRLLSPFTSIASNATPELINDVLDQFPTPVDLMTQLDEIAKAIDTTKGLLNDMSHISGLSLDAFNTTLDTCYADLRKIANQYISDSPYVPNMSGLRAYQGMLDTVSDNIKYYMNAVGAKLYVPMSVEDIAQRGAESIGPKQHLINQVSDALLNEAKHAGAETIQERTCRDYIRDVRDMQSFRNADGTWDVGALEQVWSINVSNATATNILLDNGATTACVEEFTDIASPVRRTISNLKDLMNETIQKNADMGIDSPDVVDALGTVQELESNLIAIEGNKHLRDAFVAFADGCPSRDQVALLDAMATNTSTARFNNYVLMYARTKDARYLDYLMDDIMYNAEDFLRNTSDVKLDYLFSEGCNTLDTAGNVQHIQKLAADRIAASDEYIDVYYSATSAHRFGAPIEISFRVGDETVTFRNASGRLMLKSNSDANRMFGVGDKAQMLAQFDEYWSNADKLSEDDFLSAINTYLMGLNNRALNAGGDTRKTFRIIGFNTGANTVGTDRFMRKFLTQNDIKFYWDDFQDVAEIMRAEKGMAALDSNTCMALRSALESVCDVQTAKAIALGIDPSLFVDSRVDLKVLGDALKSITEEYAGKTIDEITQFADKLGVAAKAVSAQRANVLGDLDTLLLSRGVLQDIVYSAGASRNINVARVLNALSPEDALANRYSLKTIFKNESVTAWYGEDYLTKIQDKLSQVRGLNVKMQSMYDAAATLDSYKLSIANHALLNAIGDEACIKYYELYSTVLIKKLMDAGKVDLANAIMLFKAPETAEDCAALIRYLQVNFKAESGVLGDTVWHTVNGLIEDPSIVSAFGNIGDASRVFNKDVLDTLVYESSYSVKYSNFEVNAVINKYTGVFNTSSQVRYLEGKLIEQANIHRDLDIVFKDIETVHKQFGIYTAEDYIKYKLTTPMFEGYNHLVDDFNTSVKAMFDDAFKDQYTRLYGDVAVPVIDDITKVTADTVEGALAIKVYNETMSNATAALNYVSNMRSRATLHALANMSTEDVEHYVLRYAANQLVINPASLNLSAKEAAEFEAMLTNLSKTSDLLQINTVKVGTADCITFSLKTSDLSYKELDDLIRKYEALDLDMTSRMRDAMHAVYADIPETLEYRTFVNMLYDDLDMYNSAVHHALPDTYLCSDMNVITADTFKAINNLNGVPNPNALEHGRIKNWFDEGFNCSIVGDTTFQRQFNPYATGDLMSNMGQGLYHVRNRTAYTTNYINLLSNETSQVSYFLRSAGMEDIGYKEFADALEKGGMEIVTIDKAASVRGVEQFTIKRIELTSAAQFDKIKNATAGYALIPHHVYGALSNYAGKVNAEMLYDALHVAGEVTNMDKMVYNLSALRQLRVSMQLLGSSLFGAGFRNYVDSNIKMYGELGFSEDVAMRYVNSAELNKLYDFTAYHIIEEYGALTPENISLAFAKGTVPGGMLYDDFVNFHTFRTMDSVGMSGLLAEMQSDATNAQIKNFLQDSTALSKYTDGEVDDVVKDIRMLLNETHATGDFKYMPNAAKATRQSELYETALDKFTKFYGDSMTDAELKDLAGLVYHITPDYEGLMAQINRRSGLIGRVNETIFNANAKMFSEAEERVRTTIYLTARERGMSAGAAEAFVVKSQFDYNIRPTALSKVERLAPFTTFRFYNTLYWLNEVPSKYTYSKVASKLIGITDPGYTDSDIAEIIRMQHLNQYISQHANDPVMKDASNDDINNAMDMLTELLDYYGDSINHYMGANMNTTSGIPIGYNRVLKIGNSFTDAINTVTALITAPAELAHGLIPSIIADSAYAPIHSAFKYYNDIRTGNIDLRKDTSKPYSFNNVSLDKVKDTLLSPTGPLISTGLPMVNEMFNLALSHIKNAKYSINDIKSIILNPTAQISLSQQADRIALDTLGFMFPSIVGLTKDSGYFTRPIGTNWYTNASTKTWKQRINPETGTYYTDEEAEALVQSYKSTHQFVHGISDIPVKVPTNPATYISSKSIYMHMGFSEEEAEEIIRKLYATGSWKDVDELGYKYQINEAYLNYYNGKVYYNTELFNASLAALREEYPDKTLDELIGMMSSCQWYNPTTHEFMSNSNVISSVLGNAILTEYENIPDYMKYDATQRGKLVDYWKSLGLTTKQAYAMMASENGYIDEHGQYIILTDAQVKNREEEINEDYANFKANLPGWLQYETGLVSGTVKYLMNTYNISQEKARELMATNGYIFEDGVLRVLTAEESAARQRVADEFISNVPDAIRYEKGAISRTLQYLKTYYGMSNEEAKQAIINGYMLNAADTLINVNELTRAYLTKDQWLADNAFNKKYAELYDTLPDYIRYEQGAFERTLTGLKAAGLSEADAIKAIQQGAYLVEAPQAASTAAIRLMAYNGASQNTAPGSVINVDGKEYIVVDSSGLQHINPRPTKNYSNKHYYNNYASYKKVPRPKQQRQVKHYYNQFVAKPYVTNKSNSSTYSKVNVLAGASYGVRRINKINFGTSPITQTLSIKSTYPASYRNIVYGTRHNMYKDLYAKYGMSRMLMRSNAAHTYSNASITRLRRNEIQNRVKYGNRRAKTPTTQSMGNQFTTKK